MKLVERVRRPASSPSTLVDKIHETATTPVKFMEVCGTHTVAIAKNGLRDVMPEHHHAALRPRLSRSA